MLIITKLLVKNKKQPIKLFIIIKELWKAILDTGKLFF